MRNLMCAAVLAWPALAGAQGTGTQFPVTQSGQPWRASSAMAPDGRFVVTWTEPARSSSFRGWARRFDAMGQPLGPEFLVSADTSSSKGRPAVNMRPDGGFTIIWAGADVINPTGWAVRGQRYDANGMPMGGEFLASSASANRSTHSDPALASDAAGNTVIVWTRAFGWPAADNGGRVYARRYDSAGLPLGGEFKVNTYTGGNQVMPAVAFDTGGGFVVAWAGTHQDGSEAGVFAQRYAGSGAPLGGEFAVNTYTTGVQSFPEVGPAGSGGFVIAWIASDGVDEAGAGVFARQYDAAGVPLGPEFRVSSTAVRLAPHAFSILPDGRGGYAIGWVSGGDVVMVRLYDAAGRPMGPAVEVLRQGTTLSEPRVSGNGSGRLLLTWSQGQSVTQVRGQFAGAGWPVALTVDEAPGTSNQNGVLDPGEEAVVAPAWANLGPPASVTGHAYRFFGPGWPADPSYWIPDDSAQFGTIAPGTSASCASQNDCYVLAVSVPAQRPLRHMDAVLFDEVLVGSALEYKTWIIHIGGSFDDVSRLNPFYRFVETLMHNGVSTGCGPTTYCPQSVATREQMAVFLLGAKLGPGYQPPQPPIGVFTDVPASSPFAAWIEDLWNREVVTGCAADRYCPQDPVTRAQMAVMVLRAAEGASYTPPPCVTPPFTDVPCSDPFARWIAEVTRRGVTAGCGGGAYCPGGAVTREQMAVFLSRGFGLGLYGP